MSSPAPVDLSGWHARLDSGNGPALRAATIERAAAATDSHNAFISTAPHSSEDGAAGPLAGIPFAVKDNIHTADLRTTGGCRALDEWTADSDAPTVLALRRAGGWVVGKTNLHELALGVTSNNASYGAVRNPADPARSPGGSSGGSAAAVALGVVPFALGTDTGGSMTIPAAATGVVGYRPSTRRYSSDGVIHISHTRDEVGVFANTVDDVSFVDGILRKEYAVPAAPRGVIRLGVPDRYLRDLDESTELAATRALTVLAGEGVELHPVSIDELVDGAHAHGFTVVGVESLVGLEAFLGVTSPHLSLNLDTLIAGVASSDVRALLADLRENPIPPRDYHRALTERARLRTTMTQLMTRDRLDALVYPTTPTLPPLLGEDVVRSPVGDLSAFATLTRHTEAGSFLGDPSVSLPIAAPDEPPVGLTLEGAAGSDARLLELAAQVSRLLTSVTTSVPRRATR